MDHTALHTCTFIISAAFGRASSTDFNTACTKYISTVRRLSGRPVQGSGISYFEDSQQQGSSLRTPTHAAREVTPCTLAQSGLCCFSFRQHTLGVGTGSWKKKQVREEQW